MNDNGYGPDGFPHGDHTAARPVLGSPAVGDVVGDGNGILDIVVAWGTLPESSTTPGGFGAFRNNGPGNGFTLLWQRATLDLAAPSAPGPTGIPTA